MHNLVLELDNNLSFGSNKEPSSSVDEENTTISMAKSSPLNNVHMDIDLNFEDKQVIGKGTYATVYKCQLHGTDIAVKVFQPTATLTTEVRIQVSKGKIYLANFLCSYVHKSLDYVLISKVLKRNRK